MLCRKILRLGCSIVRSLAEVQRMYLINAPERFGESYLNIVYSISTYIKGPSPRTSSITKPSRVERVVIEHEGDK